MESSVAPRPAFSPLQRATARHLQWARDYLAVGDCESAIEALLDAQALRDELCGVPAWNEPCTREPRSRSAVRRPRRG